MGEVLAEARTRGLLSIGERAKLRLAMGEPALSARLHSNEAWTSAASCSGGGGSFPCAPESGSARRRVQSEAAAGSDSLSMDTIAIVLSVLVGAAGYVVQAHTARRAERATAAQLHEQQEADASQERLHQQRVAQIDRTNRWLDDCCHPIRLELDAIESGRSTFVAGAVLVLEEEQRREDDRAQVELLHRLRVLEQREQPVVGVVVELEERLHARLLHDVLAHLIKVGCRVGGSCAG